VAAIRFQKFGSVLAYGTWSNSVEVVSADRRARTVFRLTSTAPPKYIAFDNKGGAMAVANT
jgi:hypothetical protein